MPVPRALLPLALLAACCLKANAFLLRRLDNNLEQYPHQTALFGPQPGHYNQTGLIHLHRQEVELCDPLHGDSYLRGSIALVLRGGCPFITKALNAQMAGAVGLVVSNNVDDQLKYMDADPGSDASAIVIPCVFIGKSSFLDILARMGSGDKTGLLTAAGEYENTSSLLLLVRTGGIAVGSVLFVSILCSLFRACRRRQDRHVRVNASQRMPLVEFAPEELETGLRSTVINSSCAVCLEDFNAKEKIKILPCHHGFHGECIDEWLERSDLCPICKASVLDVSEDDPLFRGVLPRRRCGRLRSCCPGAR